MKFLTKQGLQHFLDRLKGIIPSKTSDLTNDSGFLTSHNPVDSALSSTSTNAVQNKVINNALTGKSDTGHTHSASDVSGLSTVATSGSYNDLSNKPTIPTVNNATLTIQKNGTTVKTFSANASSNVTANITVPTKTSDLTNDSGFLTTHNPIDSSLSSTSTNAVQNKVVNDALTGKSNTGHSHTVSDISDFPTLSTVATSGSYNDLSNKPTIPTVNNKTLTIQKNGSNVATFTANSSSNVTANITVPTNVSELTNDSGYLTASSNLDSSKLTGTIDIARLPKGALERLVTVANQTARFALTTSDVQLGDTVKQLDTGVMYIVSDETKLSSNDGYTEYTAGSATSVPWSGVSGKPSSFTPSSHTHGSITNDGKLGTASRALITDSSKKIAVSSVTSTELGYLSGVTSAIQTQLNGKAASSHSHTTSEVTDLLNSQHTWTAVQTYQPTNFYHFAANPCNILKDTELEEGVAPATAHTAYPGAWYDKNSNLLGYSRFVEYDSGITAFEVDIRNKAKNGALDPTGTQLRGGFQLVINPDETSHLRIYANTLPNTTNAYNLGDATHQWNNLYAKNYFYNGTTWGLDKANVWTGHNYFPLSLSQKGFSPRATTPATAEFGVLSIEDTNSLPVLSINYANRDSGTRDISLRIYDTSGNSDGVGYFRSSSFNAFQPLSGNIDLGSSSNKWKIAYADNITTSSVCLQGDRNAYIVPMWAGAGSGISLLTQDASKSVYVGARTTDENNRSVLDSTKGQIKMTAGETGGNNVACIEPIAASSTLGTTSHYWSQVFGGEYHAYNGNAFMAKNGGYTFLIRNDGSNTYFLMSEQNGGEGTYSNARPLIINNATGVCNINGNCGGSSNGLATSSSFVQNGLTFSGGMFAIGDTAGKAYKGSSNNPSLISFPENGTYWNDTTVNIQNLRFTWASDGKYFQDIFLSPNNDYIWHRNVGNSVAKGWRRIVEENVSGLTDQTWDISIAGNAATASSVAWANVSGRPTNVSSFTNDSGYLTSHQSLSNYSTLANTVKSLSISGKTITVTPGSGSAYTLTTQDTVYTHPTTAGNKHIPSGGSANQYLKYSSSGTAVWATINSSELNNDQNYSRGLNSHAINFDWSETYSNKVGIKVDNTWLGGILTTSNTTIPTKTSDLTNDSGFLTSHQSLSNYVTLNGSQIITGQKTFQSGGTTIKVKATNHERGVKPSTDSHNIIQFCDKSGYQIGYITRYKNTSGYSCVQINSSDYYKNEAMASDGTEVGATLTIGTSSKGNPYWQAPMGSWENIYPHSERNNSLSIGTFTNRWNQVFANEYHAYNGNGYMLTSGDYTFLIRNDGGSTYFLVSEQNGDEGTWSTARPLQIVNSTGICNINGNAATSNEAKKVKTSITAGTVETLVDATMGSNDCFRIAAGGDTNAGWVELATGDDYNEPIYVRQYQGTYTTLKRSATLLDANGNTDFPGTVTATFSGNLTGNVTGNVTGDVTGNCSGYSRGLLTTNVFGNDRLTYTEGSFNLGSEAGQLYKGSSSNASLISAPENGTYYSSTAGNVQNLRLAWSGDGKYLHDIFVSPNNNYIWHRNVSNGTARGWRRVVEENVSGLTDQTWSINIGGSAASAANDGSGNVISTTYGKLASANTWNDNQTINKHNSSIIFKSDNVSKGTIQNVDSSTIIFTDKNNKNLCYIQQSVNGASRTIINLHVENTYKNGALSTESDATLIQSGWTFGQVWDGRAYYDFSGGSLSNIYPLNLNGVNNTLGTSTNQWNSVYSKYYYYNGTQWGLDQNNTWTGTQTFQAANVNHNYVNPYYIFKDTDIEIGVQPSYNHTATTLWRDKNSNNLGYARFVEYDNAVQTYEISLYNKASNGNLSPSGSGISASLQMALFKNGISSLNVATSQLLPTTNNSAKLGDSSHKWESIWGTNFNSVPTSTVEFHNSHYRGVNLISTGHFSNMAALLTAIRNQDWSDIYIGDYVELTFTYEGASRTVKFYVGEIDKFYNVGDTALTTHHLVMVTGNLGVNKVMNDTNSTIGGYVASKAHTTSLPALYNILNPLFNNSIITHREALSNNVKTHDNVNLVLNSGSGDVTYACSNFPIFSGGETVVRGCVTSMDWYDCNLVLMSEIEMLGSTRFSTNGLDDVMCPEGQIAVFKYNRDLQTLNRSVNTWLRNVNSISTFCCITNPGRPGRNNAASTLLQLRPRFLIG